MKPHYLLHAFLLAVCLVTALFGPFRAGPDAATHSPVGESHNPACQQAYEIAGRVHIYDDAVSLPPKFVPLAGVTIEIKSDDALLATTTADATGRFWKRIESCAAAQNIALALVPKTQATSVSYAFDATHWRLDVPSTLTAAPPGRHDFGTIRVDPRRQKAARAFQVLHAANRITAWLDAKMGSKALAKRSINIDFPSLFSRLKNVQDTFYNPLTGQIHLAEDRFPPAERDIEILAHEFTHFLQEGYGRYAIDASDIAAYGSDGRSGWSFSSRETPGVADLEGFATYLSYLFLSENGSPSHALKLESDVNNAKLGANGVFNHAAFYFDLSDTQADSRGDARDHCELSLSEILNVFAAHPAKGLAPFALLKNDAHDFAQRYERLHEGAAASCDVRAVLRLNHLE